MTIYLATDHAGFEMKEQVKAWLIERRYNVIDCGAYEYNSDDNYPDFMHMCAQKMVQNLQRLKENNYLDDVANVDAGAPQAPRSIVFGGSGTGESMVMNRYPGIRAVVYNGQNPEIVQLGRQHNDANCLSIGARFVDFDQCIHAIQIFLNTEFSAGRHSGRIIAIDNYE